jgi:hypothetical protein
MLEIWKDHPLDTNYKGSNLGNIRNKRIDKNINGTIRCIDKVFNNGNKSNKKFKNFIFECFNDIIPKNMYVVQIDHNNNNLKIENLKLVNKEEYNKYLLYDQINQKEREGWKLHSKYLYMSNKKGEIYSLASNELIKGRITNQENTMSINDNTILFKNFIYECFYGLIPEKHYIIYKDGIINNYYIDNLELVNEEQLKKYKQNQLNKIKEIKLNEDWKAHYKFLNYLGNSQGQIFSILTNEIINGHNTDGYIRINIHDDKLYNRYPVHRFIFECFNGKIEDKLQIDHINSDKTDNSIKNLQALNSHDHNQKTFKNNTDARLKQAVKMRKKILLTELDKNEKIISEKVYNCAEELEEVLDCARVTIARYAKKEIKYNNYLLKYVEEKIDNEIWKTIENDTRFEGYEFSNIGRIKKKRSNIITFGNLNNDGYYFVNINEYRYTMHYLICLAFNGKPNGEYGNEITVDHLDRNKINNKSENLKWATRIEQATNTSKVKRVIAKYMDTNEIIGIYLSASDAGRQYGLDCSTISKVCRGNRRSYGKLNNRNIIWEYENKTVI